MRSLGDRTTEVAGSRPFLAYARRPRRSRGRPREGLGVGPGVRRGRRLGQPESTGATATTRPFSPSTLAPVAPRCDGARGAGGGSRRIARLCPRLCPRPTARGTSVHDTGYGHLPAARSSAFQGRPGMASA